MGTSTSLMTTSLTSPTARKLLEDLDAELMSLYPDHPYPPPFGDDEASGIGSVLIAYRGRGIGKLLLTSLEAEAEEMGVSRIVLEAGDRQADAIGLYESRGYERIESWVDDPNPHSVFMARTLHP